jgi:hypothetical protein
VRANWQVQPTKSVRFQGKEGEMTEEKKLKLRKYPHLWQSYCLWSELVEMRKRHTLRISAAERGVSTLDAQFENDMMEHVGTDALITYAKNLMTGEGKQHPAWAWLTAIHGLGAGGLAAQLLAQIDDISSFTTVSKLWRFCGYAVIDGQIERNAKGEKGHYNRRLKSICFLIADQFIKQQTPLYVDIYYESKEADRRAHPETLCRECGIPFEQCQSKVAHHKLYNDGHIHHRAMRKAIKIFLQHLWLTWRNAEDLPVTMPYAFDVLLHTHYIAATQLEVDA